MTGGKRKRNNNTNAVDDENENSIDELNSKVENLQKNVTEILGELQKLNDTKKNEESEAEKKQSFNSVISPGSLMKNTSSSGMTPVGRSFVLKHVFGNVSKMEEGKNYNSKVESHFGVPWHMYISKKDQHISFFLQCNKLLETEEKWTMDTKYTLKFIGVNGKTNAGNVDATFGNVNNVNMFTAWGIVKYISLEELNKDYVLDDKLSAEVHVKITKMAGVYKENLRCFDETKKNYSDVVLIVKDQKFYVLKLYLASHSPYFDSLFLGSFLESNKSEIELTGIEPEDFQNFLEVLYAAPAIDEVTVEGILLVADMYNTSMAIEKCEDFLLEKSEKSNKKKLQLAIRYNLDKLKAKCMSEIKTIDDIKSIISGNLEDLESSMTTELLKKSISFQ